MQLELFEKLCHVLSYILHVGAELFWAATLLDQVSNFRLLDPLPYLVRQNRDLVIYLIDGGLESRVIDLRLNHVP